MAMLPILHWRIYYADGSTYSDANGTWRKAPSSGVQWIWLFHTPPYRTQISGQDSYLLPGQSESSRKVGTWMEDAEFEVLCARAWEDYS